MLLLRRGALQLKILSAQTDHLGDEAVDLIERELRHFTDALDVGFATEVHADIYP